MDQMTPTPSSKAFKSADAVSQSCSQRSCRLQKVLFRRSSVIVVFNNQLHWMGGGRWETGDEVIPRAFLDSLRDTLSCTDELRQNLERFLALVEPEVLEELPPLERARVFLVLATSASTLFSVRLKCGGIHLGDHPVRTELERLGLHKEKFLEYNDWNKEVILVVKYCKQLP